MTTIFSRIIAGDVPGTFVWRDDQAVAFLSVNPTVRGHTLVVPVAEVDHWLDAPPALLAHLFDVARVVGTAQQAAFGVERVGLLIAGFEVAHLHLHVIPTRSMADLDLGQAAATFADRDELESAADDIRAALRAAGHPEVAS
jgi:diadenosine tetraphosphate (Ap4A) HIT family hydrolase